MSRETRLQAIAEAAGDLITAEHDTGISESDLRSAEAAFDDALHTLTAGDCYTLIATRDEAKGLLADLTTERHNAALRGDLVTVCALSTAERLTRRRFHLPGPEEDPQDYARERRQERTSDADVEQMERDYPQEVRHG